MFQRAHFKLGWRMAAGLSVAASVLTPASLVAVRSNSAEAAMCAEGLPIDLKTMPLPAAATGIGAPTAWAAGFNGAGIDVAVIDTGVNVGPGLATAGKVVDFADFSFDAPSATVRHRDVHGHGTAMAGIIAGDGTGGPLTVGVAPGARILNVKVGAGDGSVDVSQVIAALDWIVQNKTANGRNIRVVNLAYSTDAMSDYRSDPLSHAVENAWKAGIVVVAASGNDGRSVHALGNPARNPFVIAVGGAAFDTAKLTFKVPSWSSTGDGARNPDVVAPGDSIASLRVKGSLLDTQYPLARFHDPVTCTVFLRGSGTSQGSAAVSGAVALLLQQRPTLTPDQVKYLLRTTATPMSFPEETQGKGIINVAAAMKLNPPKNTSQNFTGSTGTGSLEAARGTMHVGTSAADQLIGEYSAFLSGFSSKVWAAASDRKVAWTKAAVDSAGRFVAGTWGGSSWSGSSWSGSSWSGSSWSGSSWSGSSWSGSSWSGSSWSGSSWSGSSWSGSSWSGSSWSGSSWSGTGWA